EGLAVARRAHDLDSPDRLAGDDAAVELVRLRTRIRGHGRVLAADHLARLPAEELHGGPVPGDDVRVAVERDRRERNRLDQPREPLALGVDSLVGLAAEVGAREGEPGEERLAPRRDGR